VLFDRLVPEIPPICTRSEPASARLRRPLA